MALHALRRRLRPRTRIKQAIHAFARVAHRNPEIKQYLTRVLKLIPPLDARLRRMLVPPVHSAASFGLPTPDGQLPRDIAILLARLKLARHSARHGIDWERGYIAMPNGRPTLALVSPFPPDRSGIADYSATLLPALAAHYDITLIHTAPREADPWLHADYPVRDTAWLRRNGYSFDRVLYQFGNSSFHGEMLDLLSVLPGVVMLHDFYLSGLRLWRHVTGEAQQDWLDAVRLSHGTAALAQAGREGNDSVREQYPCNKDVIDASIGMLTHSQLGKRWAEQWYDLETADRFIQTPFALKLVDDIEPVERTRIREAFGLAENDFVVATFGHIAVTKRNDDLLDAWVASGLADDPRAHLVFVGQPSEGEYGDGIRARVDALGARVRITGYATPEDYAAWLTAADLGVQLRKQSRGETSASVFDCLSHSVPVVVNAHGWAAELPTEAVILIEDEFSTKALADALKNARQDPAAARAQGAAGRAFVRDRHAPAVSARAYRDAIEQHYAQHGGIHREILDCAKVPDTTETDLLAMAYSLFDDQPARQPRQWLVDVSVLLDQRGTPETRARLNDLLDELLRQPPAGWRIEPVYFDTAYYRYARRDTMNRLGLPGDILQDELVSVRRGDRYLGLGFGDLEHAHARLTFSAWQRRGVTLNWFVVDMYEAAPITPGIPPTAPGVPPPAPVNLVDTRLAMLLPIADRLLTPDAATAKTVIDKLDATGLARPGILGIEVCPPAAAAIAARLADPQSTHPWPQGPIQARPAPELQTA